MYRRIIAIILSVLILACALPCSAFAADDTADAKEISVVWMGTLFSKTVLEKNSGLYVPISWLTYFGILMCKESETEYEYYYADQEEPGSFAKRIFIEKEDLSFSICYYLPKYNLGLEMGAYNTWIADSLDALDASDGQEFIDKLLEAWKKKEAAVEYSKTRANYVSIYDGSFSDYIDYDGEKYLPIAELLPLMNAKIAVGDDGALYIEPNLTTLSQALYNADIGSLCFNAEDDIWGDKFVSAGGLVVDSLTSFRFDRLDFIWNSGRVSDYEEIFKAYLTEDETYLSAYDKEITPQGRALNLGKDLFKTANTAYKYLKTEKKLFDSFGWDTDEYPEFGFLEDIDENIKVNGADIVGGVYKAFDYWNAYYHQVDDHREMLNAVYSYDKNDAKQNTPSYRAAMTTYSLYSEKYAGRLLSATSECLQDYITQELPKKALMENVPAIAPYALTVDITKLILPEEYKTIHADSLIYVMDAATEKSYDVFLERKYSGQYDADSLNDLRLCAIMSLISSKYAYESIWGENYEKIDRINELLEKLYLAADGVEGDSSDYYEKKCVLLKSKINNITVCKHEGLDTNNNDSNDNSLEEHDPSESLTRIIAISAGNEHSVGLREDGTVVATGYDGNGSCSVGEWRNIVAIATGSSHTVGLKSDGTVVATGDNSFHQCDVDGWTDIKYIFADSTYTIGIKNDGTVIAAGHIFYIGYDYLAEWSDIKFITMGADHALGIKTDNTVVSVGNKELEQWENVKFASSCMYRCVGVCVDGSVLTTEYLSSCNQIEDWKNIVSIMAEWNFTVGLMSNGTVVAVGDSFFQKWGIDVSNWSDITAIATGKDYVLGLKADGTVVATGSNRTGGCDVSNW
ncbi:MAG: RCC1 domain-containing protein [Candidatus Avispirillum sp.]